MNAAVLQLVLQIHGRVAVSNASSTRTQLPQNVTENFKVIKTEQPLIQLIIKIEVITGLPVTIPQSINGVLCGSDETLP